MPAIITHDLVKGSSESTDRYFRLITWDPRTQPTNALRGTIAITVLPASTTTLQKIDDGTTTGWIEFGSGGGSHLLEYTRAFNKSAGGDWSLAANEFHLNVTHNLNDLTPIVTIFDDVGLETLCEYFLISANQIRLVVPSSPDLRFTGHVRVTKT